MRFFWTLSRAFYKPATLWCLFGFVLFLAIGGLALLSRHALRLGRQQSDSEQREDLQQNIRIALWRLDSRLGPFIATLHDPTEGNPFNNPQSDEFVMQRFRIHRAASKGEKGVRFAFAPAEPSDGMMGVAKVDNWQRLVNSIPVDSIVSAVEDLIPRVAAGPNQSLIQGYDAQVSLPAEFSRRELGNRNMIVQQQVALNTSYTELKGRGGKGAAIETEEKKDTKLMSVWIDDQLVVVRSGRTSAGDLEGVWVNWPSLRQSLADDIADLVPDATLHPVKHPDAIDPSRTLAAVPAMVVSPQREFAAFGWSPTHTAPLLAWCALVASALDCCRCTQSPDRAQRTPGLVCFGRDT